MVIKYKVYWFKDKIFTLVDTIMFLQGGIMVEDGCCYKGWNDKDCKLVAFTGLTDKNGKEIYEGDIVSFGTHEYTIIYEIGGFNLYDKEGLMIGKIGGHNDHVYPLQVLYFDCCWEDNSAFDIEIIGNIYDNPELLKDYK